MRDHLQFPAPQPLRQFTVWAAASAQATRAHLCAFPFCNQPEEPVCKELTSGGQPPHPQTDWTLIPSTEPLRCSALISIRLNNWKRRVYSGVQDLPTQ